MGPIHHPSCSLSLKTQTAMCAEMLEQLKNKMQVNPASQKYASHIVPLTRECGVVSRCLNNMSCLLAHT